MFVSLSSLPHEILTLIIENCETKELLALARSSKPLSRLAHAKLYRHVYYCHISVSASGRLEDSSDQSSDTESSGSLDDDSSCDGLEPQHSYRGWRCSLCSRKCADVLFNSEEIKAPFTLIMDLSKFSKTVSQCQDRSNLLCTLRLDLQSARGWRSEDLDDFDMDEPHTETKRWFPSRNIELAIQTLTKALGHLPLARALFISECFDGCCNPRIIQTMGMSVPFLMVLPNYAIDEKRPYKLRGKNKWPQDHGTQVVPNPVLWDLDCALEFDMARLSRDAGRPQAIIEDKLTIHESVILSLYHYIGPLVDLENLLECPNEPESYRRWLAVQPREAFQTKAVRPAILRSLRKHHEFLDERYGKSLPASAIGNQLIGDPSALGSLQQATERMNQTGSSPLPGAILLKDVVL